MSLLNNNIRQQITNRIGYTEYTKLLLENMEFKIDNKVEKISYIELSSLIGSLHNLICTNSIDISYLNDTSDDVESFNKKIANIGNDEGSIANTRARIELIRKGLSDETNLRLDALTARNKVQKQFEIEFRKDIQTLDEAFNALSSEDKISVVVYDMTGRLIERREVRPSDMVEQQIGDRYPSGVYNIVVTQGNNVKTVRVVKR
jgi:hypothetical protein